jgi:hypothetical protein
MNADLARYCHLLMEETTHGGEEKVHPSEIMTVYMSQPTVKVAKYNPGSRNYETSVQIDHYPPVFHRPDLLRAAHARLMANNDEFRQLDQSLHGVSPEVNLAVHTAQSIQSAVQQTLQNLKKK